MVIRRHHEHKFTHSLMTLFPCAKLTLVLLSHALKLAVGPNIKVTTERSIHSTRVSLAHGNKVINE